MHMACCNCHANWVTSSKYALPIFIGNHRFGRASDKMQMFTNHCQRWMSNIKRELVTSWDWSTRTHSGWMHRNKNTATFWNVQECRKSTRKNVPSLWLQCGHTFWSRNIYFLSGEFTSLESKLFESTKLCKQNSQPTEMTFKLIHENCANISN